MSNPTTETYQQIAKETRKKALELIYRAQTSHIGSCFSCVDILTVLYDKADFKKDKLVVSKGWAAAVVYILAAKHGLIPKDDLDTYCKQGSKYIGLIEPLGFFGAEFAGGSMGLGLPAAVGFALAKKMNNEAGKVYVLMSDGEMQCGTTWESALIASQHELGNLVVIVDGNGLQAMGKTDEILNLNYSDSKDVRVRIWNYDLKYKFKTFGWHSWNFDGHNYTEIEELLTKNFFDFLVSKYPNMSFQVSEKEKKALQTMPKIFIGKTIKGKGVSFMENNNLFHYKAPNEEEYQLAMKELST